MAREDTTDFLTAFAVGAVLGIGATLLLRGRPRTAKERLLRELKPFYRKKIGPGVGQVARGIRRGRAATEEMADGAIDTGRELLAEFRDEVKRIVEDARDELVEALEDGESGAAKRRSRRKPAEE
jgi:gas vesicle protein